MSEILYKKFNVDNLKYVRSREKKIKALKTKLNFVPSVGDLLSALSNTSNAR